MKIVAAVAALLFLVGCDGAGKYQFTQINGEKDAFWRFNTKTGKVAKCLFLSTTGGTVCVPIEN